MRLTKPNEWYATHLQGRLSAALTADQITNVIGWASNPRDTDGEKVTHCWRFLANRQQCAIWDYRGERWSFYGPRAVFVELFGADKVEAETFGTSCLSPVKPIDGYRGETKVPINAWLEKADRQIWSDIAQCMRVAGETVLACNKEVSASLWFRRASLASASGELAKARELARFLVEPDTRTRARKAINKMAACVRAERGV